MVNRATRDELLSEFGELATELQQELAEFLTDCPRSWGSLEALHFTADRVLTRLAEKLAVPGTSIKAYQEWTSAHGKYAAMVGGVPVPPPRLKKEKE